MIDLQKMLDTMSNLSRRDRSRHHLTLNGLIIELEAVDAKTPVVFDHGSGIGEENSYRGYYSDLSLASGGSDNAGQLLARCKRALNETYEGYKGGDFIMGPDTPLWNAEYGCTGLAITHAFKRDGSLVLATKDVD